MSHDIVVLLTVVARERTAGDICILSKKDRSELLSRSVRFVYFPVTYSLTSQSSFRSGSRKGRHYQRVPSLAPGP